MKISQCLATLAALTLPVLCGAAQPSLVNSESEGSRNHLPFGRYPHIDGVNKNRDIKPGGTLQDEVQNLGEKMEQTVKDFASHRNLTCFGDPCQIQAFPIVYTRPESGFFGGARFKLTNITRRNPYLYSIDGYVIRSDTQQWLNYLALDLPRIEPLPLDPRIKMRLSYSRTTETRYFGTGGGFIEDASNRPDEDVRYALKERGFQSTLLIPLFSFGPQEVDFATSFSTLEHMPSAFRNRASSKLFEDRPRGIEGGVSTRLGFGLLLDSRDREILSRTGWALEAFYEYAGPPFGRFKFKRVAVIDRRYASIQRFTFANRITIDSVWGDVPFWELRAVGGIDPIPDVSSSPIFRGFPSGRFHENVKIMESAELRYELNTRRFFGVLTDTTLMPIGVDLGRFGEQFALGFATGAKFLFNKGLLIQLYLATSKDARSLNLDFGQAF